MEAAARSGVLEFPKDGALKAAYSVTHGGIADGATSTCGSCTGLGIRGALAAMSIPVGALEQIVNDALAGDDARTERLRRAIFDAGF